MKSNPIFFTTLTLAAPLAFLLQSSDLAQAKGGGGGATTPFAQDAEPVAAAPAPSPRANVDFFFPGGTPGDFVNAVEKQYKVDWKEVVDIPNNMRSIHIPALRMNQQSVESIFPVYRGGGGRGGGGGGGGLGGAFGGGGRGGFGAIAEERDPLTALIALYNNVGQARQEMGELRVEGDLAKPSVVIFRSFANTTPDIKVKVFALGAIPKDQWEKLEWELNNMLSSPSLVANQAPAHFAIHPNSSLLIVVGPESALEAVESLVTAWRANTTTATTGPKN
jgi:hypothetical protein